MANQSYERAFFENRVYDRNQPTHQAMALENGIAIDRTEHAVFSRGALISHDHEGRPVVEWMCNHQHGSDDEAHECARQKWFSHHG